MQKRVLFKADFAVFWAQKEVFEAPNHVHDVLNDDETCLSIILVPMQMDSSMDILGTQTAQKMAILGHFGQMCETGVRNLRILFPAATVKFLAQPLCDGTSHPETSPTEISIESIAARRSSDFCPFRACCLLLLLLLVGAAAACYCCLLLLLAAAAACCC